MYASDGRPQVSNVVQLNARTGHLFERCAALEKECAVIHRAIAIATESQGLRAKYQYAALSQPQ
jgi:hypothetical protein